MINEAVKKFGVGDVYQVFEKSKSESAEIQINSMELKNNDNTKRFYTP
jgi:hypothetical protein